MHPLVALLFLHRMLTQMRQRQQGGAPMPSLATVARTPQPAATRPARRPRASVAASAQGHHGRSQGFQGEKGPMAAARTRPTQQTGAQPGQMPSLAALLGLLNGGTGR